METSLALYNLVSPDSADILWNVFDAPSCSQYFYSPDYPGKFFGIESGNLYEFNGESGQLSRGSIAVTSGRLFWTRFAMPDIHKLVSVRNQTVAIHELDLVTDIPPQQDLLPGSFTLGPAYPNPFNPSCVIEYALPERCHTKIGVYNILGQKVAILVDETKPAGSYSVEWNGADQSGQPVATGIYFYKMEAGDYVGSKKMLLLK